MADSDGFHFTDETARYRVPKHARATTSIVIIDPLQQIQEPVSLARASTLDLLREEAEDIAVAVSYELQSYCYDYITHISMNPSFQTTGQMCMAKPTLLAVFGLLLTLTSVQAIVVLQYIVRRVCRSKKL